MSTYSEYHLYFHIKWHIICKMIELHEKRHDLLYIEMFVIKSFVTLHYNCCQLKPVTGPISKTHQYVVSNKKKIKSKY